MSPIASISFCKGISVVTNSSPVISVINSFNFFLYNGKAEGRAGEEWAMEIKTELWCFENKRLRRL